MVIGTALALTVLMVLVFHNWKRSRVQVVQDLIPNCLLTSSPLVFITGKRSLFYFLAFWNEIPHWLASHGYDVFTLKLPWRNPDLRRKALEAFLNAKSEENRRLHLFLDGSSLEELAQILKSKYVPCLSSITLIGSELSMPLEGLRSFSAPVFELGLPTAEPSRSTPLFWFLHRLRLWPHFTSSLGQLGWRLNREQGEALLERVQFLAERDLLQHERSPNLRNHESKRPVPERSPGS